MSRSSGPTTVGPVTTTRLPKSRDRSHCQPTANRASTVAPTSVISAPPVMSRRIAASCRLSRDHWSLRPPSNRMMAIPKSTMLKRADAKGAGIDPRRGLGPEERSGEQEQHDAWHPNLARDRLSQHPGSERDGEG